MYFGKGMFKDEDPSEDFPATEKILAVLMHRYLGKGCTLFTDSFYTRPPLASFFLENQAHLVGNVKTNR